MKVKNKVSPNEDQINGFLKNPEIGPISMVNLLKYKDLAIYEDGRDSNLTGEEAYGLYAAEVVTNLTPALTQNLTIESSCRKSNGKFTPNGLLVNYAIN